MKQSHCISFVTMEMNAFLTELKSCCIILMKCWQWNFIKALKKNQKSFLECCPTLNNMMTELISCNLFQDFCEDLIFITFWRQS